MDTKVCKECGRELPLTSFKRNRYGVTSLCLECYRDKFHDGTGRHVKPATTGTLLSDPDFDEQVPGDVWRMMCRAKKWVESRGFTIKLEGEYREVKIHKLKFQ